jgi:DNA polymerase-3 subunit gamma/tau
MLGLADRGRIRALLGSILNGEAAATLAQLDEAHALGIDPAALMRGLMEHLHAVTRAKAGGIGDVLASAEERDAADELAGKLGWGSLHRLWQMLLKGLGDVQIAPDPQEAAAMALLRVIHAAELPDPATVLARLQNGEGVPTAAPLARAPAAASAAMAQAEPAPTTFLQLVEALEKAGKQLLGLQLRDQISVVRFQTGELVLRPLQPLGADFPRVLADALRQLTGRAWRVELSNEDGQPSLRQQEQMAEDRARAAVLADPNVAAVLSAFPGAQLECVTAKEA